MKMKWNELAKARMKAVGVTQNTLAEKLNLSQSAIAHWLGGKREPSIDSIGEILKTLGLDKMILHSDGTLDYPDEKLVNVHSTEFKPLHYKEFPLINTVQAGGWTDISLDGTDYIMHPSTKRASDGSFWLEVEGDSMTSMSPPSFPEGTLILIDPEVQAHSKSFVITTINGGNESTFKQLIKDAGRSYLKPLNSNYPILELPETSSIVGVVVDAKYNIF